VGSQKDWQVICKASGTILGCSFNLFKNLQGFF
jgi:hypothetical protein